MPQMLRQVVFGAAGLNANIFAGSAFEYVTDARMRARNYFLPATQTKGTSSVNVFGRMISWGGQPFGAAAGALISAVLDVRAAYMFTVIVTAISAFMAYIFLRPGTEIVTTTRSS